MVCYCWKAHEASVSHGLCKQRLGGLSPKLKYMCKQKRRGMICLWVEITSFMGAALESLVDKRDIVFADYRSLTILIHHSKLIFLFSI